MFKPAATAPCLYLGMGIVIQPVTVLEGSLVDIKY